MLLSEKRHYPAVRDFYWTQRVLVIVNGLFVSCADYEMLFRRPEHETIVTNMRFYERNLEKHDRITILSFEGTPCRSFDLNLRENVPHLEWLSLDLNLGTTS